MRTTIEFDPDTEKAIERLRRERGLGTSEAVNELVRRGLTAPEPEQHYEPIHRDLGLTIDVSNISDALDLLEGPEARECSSTPTSCSPRSTPTARSTSAPTPG